PIARASARPLSVRLRCVEQSSYPVMLSSFWPKSVAACRKKRTYPPPRSAARSAGPASSVAAGFAGAHVHPPAVAANTPSAATKARMRNGDAAGIIETPRRCYRPGLVLREIYIEVLPVRREIVGVEA